MKKIAIIDICGTLFNSNTTFDFLDKEDKRFLKLRKNPILKMINKIAVKFFCYDFIRAIGVKKLTGRSTDYLQTKASIFYDEHLKQKINIEPMSLMLALREQGYSIILVSGTLDFIAKEIGLRVGADEVYSTKLLYSNNVCTGIIDTELLGHKDKILDEINARYTDGTTVYTITDNKSDINIIKKSNYKCVVSAAKNVNYWRKKLKNDYKLIEI